MHRATEFDLALDFVGASIMRRICAGVGGFGGFCHVAAAFVILAVVRLCSASLGDMSHPYRKCFQICQTSRCNHPASNIRFYSSQPVHRRLLGWDCDSECKYECMWEAVDFFQKNDIDVPQFHGKWPFVRWMGIQEPASAIASVLNGIATYVMLRRYNRIFPPSTPFYHVWRLYAFVVINAWVWSFIFHVRDTKWTEKFDYFSAFSLILVQLYCCLVRIVGTFPARRPLVLGLVLGLVYLHHCVSMSLVNFDYGYNMKINLFFAGINFITWFSFCGYMMWKGYAHFRLGLAAITMFAASGILETFEFTPIWWAIDSHALFHFFTVPVPILTFGFIIEDSKALLRGEERQSKTAYHFELNVDEPIINYANYNDNYDFSNVNYNDDRRKAE